MATAPVLVPLWLDLAAVITSALGGSLVAVRAKFDVTGLAALGILTGLGGGIMRDVLLNQTPVAIQSPWYILAAVGASATVAVLAHQTQKFVWLLLVFDAAALGLYGVTGANKALANGVGPIPALLVGLIAGLGGGVLCDLMTAKPPAIFQRGHLYATAAFFGIAAYVIAVRLGAPPDTSAVFAAMVVFGLRMAARSRDWKAPQPVDFARQIKGRIDRD
ncbi:MAG: TRIC cation channel family protein [Solirubrobacterales bacterium]|nr:TRIC cation channel family protein [Solirubrobacterales bacterium]